MNYRRILLRFLVRHMRWGDINLKMNWSPWVPIASNPCNSTFPSFKALVLHLKQCGIEKKEEQLVFSILLKLGPNYSVFVSTFHATKLTTRAWKMPSLAYFMEFLTQEQDKLVMMGTIKPSKDQDLVAGDSRVDSKGKNKAKNPPKKKRDKNKS